MKRDFETWFMTMRDTIATWTYYTDFENVYGRIDDIKIELNILNSLVGSKNIKEDFIGLLKRYPDVLKAIPILLAKRGEEISIASPGSTWSFDFEKPNCGVDQYAVFMEKSGLFDLIGNHIINNLVDYVLGVEVGMDSNARKNRTGKAMEGLLESYLVKAGLIDGKTYFKQFPASEMKGRFGIDLSPIGGEKRAEKRFDFVFLTKAGEVYAAECNFYNGGGSKLNETARSYKMLALESMGIERFRFVWFTDGKGWRSAKSNLKETFDVLDDLYDIEDLENGCIDMLVDPRRSLASYSEYLEIQLGHNG